MRLSALVIAAALLAAPAAAQVQTLDPLAAHRLQMEEIRARTEMQGLNAAVYDLQTAQARQQLQAAARAEPIIVAPAPSIYAPVSSARCVRPKTAVARAACDAAAGRRTADPARAR